MNGPAFARLLASLPEFSFDYVWAKAETLDKVARLYEQATEKLRAESDRLFLGVQALGLANIDLASENDRLRARLCREIAAGCYCCCLNCEHTPCGGEMCSTAPSEPATRVDQADGAGDE